MMSVCDTCIVGAGFRNLNMITMAQWFSHVNIFFKIIIGSWRAELDSVARPVLRRAGLPHEGRRSR